jgi:hypothetical protein
MINFSRFFTLFENFETVSKLFLDPQHRDKEWEELHKEFEATGGKEMGAGFYGKVYHHPKWPYVVKMFTKDDPYLSFARFAYKHPHKSFPKLYGPPRKITPEFSRDRSMGQVYLSRIEKLNPISTHTFEQIQKYAQPYNQYIYMTEREPMARRFYGNEYDLRLAEVKDHLSDIPDNILSVLDAREIIEKASRDGNWGASDWASRNIMQRDNGDLVVIDPVWEGHNIFAVAREQERMEQDFGGFEDMLDDAMNDREIKPNLIKGGVRPKKVPKKKPFKSMLNIPDDNLGSW